MHITRKKLIRSLTHSNQIRKTELFQRSQSISRDVSNQQYCASVDNKYVTWYICVMCRPVIFRSGCILNNGIWYENFCSKYNHKKETKKKSIKRKNRQY